MLHLVTASAGNNCPHPTALRVSGSEQKETQNSGFHEAGPRVPSLVLTPPSPAQKAGCPYSLVPPSLGAPRVGGKKPEQALGFLWAGQPPSSGPPTTNRAL